MGEMGGGKGGLNSRGSTHQSKSVDLKAWWFLVPEL